jgi:formylglycine-generating enzyme required for sulfatase activity
VSGARRLLVVALAIASTTSLSCQVNDYCLNCATGDGGNGDGGNGDGGNGDGGTDGNTTDGGPCVVTGSEVCDGKDNDCDGAVDEGTLPEIGDLCTEQRGECQGAIKQCVSGTIRCSKVPVAEICNLKDDDCDGVIDNGDPGDGVVATGAKCGTDVGECVAGRFHCNTQTGTVTCGLNCGTAQAFDCPVGGTIAPFGVPDTSCDGRDDDCDGAFDEHAPSGAACGGGTVNGGTSICQQGTLQCVGGQTVCIGAINPEPFESCDQMDNNCNGQVDEGFDLATDPLNCGACNAVCDLPNAFEGCADPDGAGPLPPACTVIACTTLADGSSFHNNDGDPTNGCEFGPCKITNTIEVCNGIDDDCNPATDEANLTPPAGLCASLGACQGATATCQGALGFRCVYSGDVELDANGNIVGQETLCDGIDNDCDGLVDEGEVGLGTVCVEPGEQGICQGSGTIQCVAGDPSATPVCVITNPGQTQQAFETCNDLDDDCDGIVDEGANTGELAGQEWVTIPGSGGVEIMKYEASRRDATDLTDGATSTFACSKPDVLPWTNITYPTAKAICESMTTTGGKQGRLCTEAEWQSMCMPRVTYPVTGPATTGETDFTFVEAEDPFLNTTIGGSARAWTPVTAGLGGATFLQVPENGFVVHSAADALAQSSRLDYRFTLLPSTTYHVWARMRSPTVSSVALGTHTPPATGATATSSASVAVGDLVIVVTWTRATSGGVPGHTLQSGFVQILSQELDDGSNDGRLSVAFKVATAAGAQPYTAYSVSGGGTSFTGLVVMPAGTFDLDGIAGTSTSSGSTNPPNPPISPTASRQSAVFAIGAWHLNASLTASVTPPNNGAPNTFAELWEIGGAAVGELSVAVRATTVAAGGTVNPNSFDDDVGPNGTAAATILVPISRSRSVFAGLTQGTGTPNAPTQILRVPADNQTRWAVSGPLTTAAGGSTTYTLSLFTREDGLMIDTIALARQSIVSPTFDHAWAYETNPRIAQPQTCNANPVDTDPGTPGDQDDVLPTGSFAACFANQNASNDAFDMSGNVKEWTLARAPNQNPMRGGASNNEVEGTTCQINFSLADDEFFFPNVGFRCCRGP